MTTLRMTFSTQQNFIRACEHFENYSKFNNSDICHENMSIDFESKNNVGAEKTLYAIENEVANLDFEYNNFFIVK